MKRTNMLIILCVFVSLFYWLVDPTIAEQFLVFRASDFLRGKVWTVITALFIHVNLLHLIGNILFLFVFGNTLENTLGARKMILAFFIGGTSSFILSSFFYGIDVSMAGASAAIFTLAAVVMLIKPLKFSWLFFMPLGLVAILYFAYNLLAVYTAVQGNVGYVGHIIGFLIGFPLGIAWSQRRWLRNLLISILLLIAYMIIIFIIQTFRLI